VEEISQRGHVDFSYHIGPPNLSVGVWDEKLSLDAHGQVNITMDPASNPEWDVSRDLKQVEAYVAQCMQLSGIPHHQKRWRKQAQQAGKGKQAEERMVIDVDE
jgi:hypothetical protein